MLCGEAFTSVSPAEGAWGAAPRRADGARRRYCARRVLRGVAPAVYRRHRIVKRLREQKVKDLSQKVQGVTQEALATGGRDLRLRRVRRLFLQHHRARVLRPGLFRAWLDGQAVSRSCLAMAIISTLLLLVSVCICHCAYCYPSFVKAAEENKFLKKTALPKALRSARGGCVDLRTSYC